MQGASGKLQGKLTDMNDMHEPSASVVYINHFNTANTFCRISLIDLRFGDTCKEGYIFNVTISFTFLLLNLASFWVL